MDKRQILSDITFGESIAELESKKLQDYFIETDYWRNVRKGKVDVIYGAKGSGKSAIYTTITNDAEAMFFDQAVLLAAAENPSGNTAFSSLTTDPPTSFNEFVALWKLYFLVITAQVLKEYNIKTGKAAKFFKILEDCNLIPPHNRLAQFLKLCLDFIRRKKEVSTTAEIDPTTGMYSGQKFSITFSEPSLQEVSLGHLPVEEVYDLLSEVLAENEFTLWIIIDRLDVAFAEHEELESNALKALFKAYLDLKKHPEVQLKIFLRDDIWRNLVDGGFREASHITKYQDLQWNRDALLNLIIKRLLDNPVLIEVFKLDKVEILKKIQDQEKTFYKFFPTQVDSGQNKPKTLDWVLGRTRDGKGQNTPREIIQLLNYAKEIQIKRLENGNDDLSDDVLISRTSLKEAVGRVSKQRIEQTIYAEYSSLKEYIELLRNGKAEQTMQTLAIKWSCNDSDASKIVKQLCDIGFFEQKGQSPDIKYKIPFLYRPYLGITQGSANIADGDLEYQDEE